MKKLIKSFILKMFSQLGCEKLHAKMYRIASFLFLSTIITACMTHETSLIVERGQTLKPEEAILAIRFHNSSEGLMSTGSNSFRLTSEQVGGNFKLNFTIVKPNELFVYAIPAGEYRWKDIKIAQYKGTFSKNSRFVVRAGEMVYVGDIYVHHIIWLFGIKSKISVHDKYEEALKELNFDYPSMVKEYGLSKRLTTMEMY